MSDTPTGGTLLSGTDAPAAPAGMDWLPEAYRADPAFRDFKDIAGLARSFKDTQAFVGADKATLLRLPKDDADAAAWSDVYARLGRPEQPDGYQFEAPEGFPEEPLKAFRSAAHALGLTQKQAAGVMGFYAQQEATARAALAETAEADLRKEWGQAFDGNMATAKRALREVGGDEVLEVLERTGLGNNAAVIRMFAKLGAERAEPGALKGGSGGGLSGPLTPAAASARMGEKLRDKDFSAALHDREHPGHAEALREWTDLNRQAFTG